MAAAGGKQGRDPARFVYVNRFGSHRCGGVLQLGGRGAKRRWSLGPGARSSQEGPRGAAGGGGERPPGPEPRAPAAARAGLTQKTLAKKFDFPIPLNEASKIMKKKKKGSVWNRVHKIISRMLEENEKYRLRLKCQGLSSENSNHTG